jgi:hypothetical protein
MKEGDFIVYGRFFQHVPLLQRKKDNFSKITKTHIFTR